MKSWRFSCFLLFVSIGKLELNYVTIDNQYNYRSIDVTLLLRTGGPHALRKLSISVKLKSSYPIAII